MELGNHELDRAFGSVILLVLPILLWHFTKLNRSTFILSLIITLSFLEGSLELLGLLPSNYNALFRDLLLFIGLVDVIFQKPTIRLTEWGMLSLIIVSLIASFLMNDANPVQLVYYLRKTIPNLLLFYYVLNLPIVEESIKSLKKYIVLLFVIQIPIAFVKIMLYGVYENYIGSMSNIAGSVSSSFTLIAVAYLWSHYLIRNNSKTLIWIFLFIFFAISGGKRSVVVFIPIIFVFGYFYQGKLSLNRLFTIFGLVAVLSSLFVYLNFNSKLKGNGLTLKSSFNLVSNFTLLKNYYMARASAEENSELGVSNNRLLAYGFYFTQYGSNLNNLLLGFTGPGGLYPSNSRERRKYGTGEQYMFNKYRVGYGMRVGVLWNIFQVGLLFLVGYFGLVYRATRHNSLKRKLSEQDYLFLKLLFIVFFMDTVIYSSTFIIPNVITTVFYFVLGLYNNPNYTSANIVENELPADV